ncbi:MAG: hypothetical protein QOD55_2584 [Solirubrobacteraceae bacterium]|nr:hypothetical protein [Solirubrobacteraceae bacterium]
MQSSDQSPTTPAEPRRLHRSPDDRMIGGVCGGLAQHLGIDPLVVRVAAVALALAGGAGLAAYLAAWLLAPLGPAAAPGTAAPASPPVKVFNVVDAPPAQRRPTVPA